MIAITQDTIGAFDRDGFVVIPDVLTLREIDRAQARFEPLFSGEFETGLYPDEWNWRLGRDAPELTRQICNGWKSATGARSTRRFTSSTRLVRRRC